MRITTFSTFSVTIEPSDVEMVTATYPPPSGGMHRSLTKRQRLVRAITNPDTIFTRDPSSPPAESAFRSEKLANSKFARTIFAPNLDVGAGVVPRHSPSVLRSHLSQNANSRGHSRVSSTVSEHRPSASTPLFDPKLLEHFEGLEELEDGYVLRPLQQDDFARGYLDVLRMQGKVGRVTEAQFEAQVEEMRNSRNTYFPVVLVDTRDGLMAFDGAEGMVKVGGKVKAAGMLVLERKFMNNCALIGHIEDIAVARDQKGKKMGLRILQALIHVGDELGCLKCVVGCDGRNESFHAQAGFVNEGVHMAFKLPPKAAEGALIELQ